MRSLLPLTTVGAVVAATAAVVVTTAPSAQALPAQTAFALRGSELLSFDPAKPGDVVAAPITGVTAGETLIGIDVRPQNGQLYALGVDADADTATLYQLSEQTAYAAVVGTAGAIAFTSDGTAKVDLPDPATNGYGFDVNPSVDRIRVTGGSVNFRVDPNTGAPVDGDNGATAGTVSGTNPDGAVNGPVTAINGAAYTNNHPDNGAVTTLYTLDAGTDSLYVQNPPNAGTQTQGTRLTVASNGLQLDFEGVGGFDIDATVDAPSNNAPVTSGVGYAALVDRDGRSRLYVIDLASGRAASVGPIGDGTDVRGLAVQRRLSDAGVPAVGLDATGANLVRFRTGQPSARTTVPVTGVGAGESLVGIAWRPQNGQLVGLGVNPLLDTGTLYRVDPQNGTATVIGTAGSIAWTTDGLVPVDLPDPATTPYGFDVNPTVDRVRIVAGTLNARANPATGAAVDGNNGGADGSVTGTNPDGSPSTALAATSYTNSWGRALPATPAEAGPTTQYVLDAGGNQLLVQNPPNAGTLTLARPVTVNGEPLDFGAPAAFDIPGSVSVTTSGTNAAGSAYAVLTVGGSTGLYGINLTTGRAGLIGASTGLRSIAVGEAQADRPAPPAPVRPAARLRKVAEVRQQGRRVDSGRVLVCSAGFAKAVCTGKTTLRAGGLGRGAVLGKSTFRIGRGKQARLSVRLSQDGVKRLRRQGKITAVVAIYAQTGPAGAYRTTRLVFTLREGRL